MSEDPLSEMDEELQEKVYKCQVIYEIEVNAIDAEDAIQQCAMYYGEYGHRLMPDRITVDLTKSFFEG